MELPQNILNRFTITTKPAKALQLAELKKMIAPVHGWPLAVKITNEYPLSQVEEGIKFAQERGKFNNTGYFLWCLKNC